MYSSNFNILRKKEYDKEAFIAAIENLAKSFTKSEIAKKLGFSAQALSNYTSGRVKPSSNIVVALEEHYGIRIPLVDQGSPGQEGLEEIFEKFQDISPEEVAFYINENIVYLSGSRQFDEYIAQKAVGYVREQMERLIKERMVK